MENFRGPFYDDVIYRDASNLWLNEELKIKRLEVDVGVNLELIGCLMYSRNYSNLNGFTNLLRQRWG